MRDESVQIVVLGAGAAGCLAAIFAARAGANVLLIEGRSQPGAKIHVSGGGRCNILPSRLELADFHTSESELSLRNVLFSWPLEKVRGFFEDELGIALKVEAGGKVFPRSDNPREVSRALLEECARCGVELRCGVRVTSIDTSGFDPFRLSIESGEAISCERLILATGGRSLPRTGSDGWGLDATRKLGHDLATQYPVLVPLLSDDELWLSLPGLSLPVTLTVYDNSGDLARRSGDFLFTHRGFSGPVVLDISRQLASRAHSDGLELRARWGGEEAPCWSEEFQRGGKQSVLGLLREHLPRRLAEFLMERSGLRKELRICDLCREGRDALIEDLEDCLLPVCGNEGYATAEAMGGGVRLSELRLKTLESRVVPGLHFAGEMIDVDGRIGGYNFLWAWVSGRRAGAGAGGGAAGGITAAP